VFPSRCGATAASTLCKACNISDQPVDSPQASASASGRIGECIIHAI
jgi:hypothetical protein